MHSSVGRPILTPDVHAEQRRAFRHPLSAGLRCVALGRWPVTMIDISELGCQLQQPIPLDMGSFVLLYIPTFDPFGGTLVWTGRDAVGVQFSDRLHVSVVDHIVRDAGASPADA